MDEKNNCILFFCLLSIAFFVFMIFIWWANLELQTELQNSSLERSCLEYENYIWADSCIKSDGQVVFLLNKAACAFKDDCNHTTIEWDEKLECLKWGWEK